MTFKQPYINYINTDYISDIMHLIKNMFYNIFYR